MLTVAEDKFLVGDQMCVEFFQVIFTVRDEVQTIRRLLIEHAQATILDCAPVERADKGEDKMQTLQNIYYMGCIVYDTSIEFMDSQAFSRVASCQNNS